MTSGSARKEVARLLQACDLQAAVGRRDHAILLLLACLGLRAGEIIALGFPHISHVNIVFDQAMPGLTCVRL